MAVNLPLTGAGDTTASARTRNGGTRDGTHSQSVDLDPPGGANLTRPSMTTGSATLLAANSARCRVIIVNEAAAELLVKEGATASATSYTWRVAPGGTLVLNPPCYQGILDGILVAGSASAQVTEEVYS